MMRSFELFLENNEILDEIFLDDNNLREQNAEAILKAIALCFQMKTISIGKNFFGQEYKDIPPPITVLTDMLMRSTMLKTLDISENHMDSKSIFCLSKGLQISRSLTHLSVEGNSIGQSGIRFLMNARATNRNTEFTLNMKMAEEETGQGN
jgi:Ran GTPase-activating protein (RanGAP) involved in mRNA processing and transport